jgi:hypothetical protein
MENGATVQFIPNYTLRETPQKATTMALKEETL